MIGADDHDVTFALAELLECGRVVRGVERPLDELLLPSVGREVSLFAREHADDAFIRQAQMHPSSVIWQIYIKHVCPSLG